MIVFTYFSNCGYCTTKSYYDRDNVPSFNIDYRIWITFVFADWFRRLEDPSEFQQIVIALTDSWSFNFWLKCYTNLKHTVKSFVYISKAQTKRANITGVQYFRGLWYWLHAHQQEWYQLRLLSLIFSVLNFLTICANSPFRPHHRNQQSAPPPSEYYHP